jgi:hypothetical protein
VSALSALQSALAAEHACVHGYGVVGARVDAADERRARAAFEAHRARRDALVQTVREARGEPVAALGAYDLPEPTPTGAAARAFAAELEDGAAGAYADLVAAARGPLRDSAYAWLAEAAVRAAGWRGSAAGPWPGLEGRSPAPSPSPTR